MDRARLGRVADRLVKKSGDQVVFVTFSVVDGSSEEDAPTLERGLTTVNAVVTGASNWADGSQILMTDKAVLVGGGAPVFSVSDQVIIDDITHVIVSVEKLIAAGVHSAVRYIVRRGASA